MEYKKIEGCSYNIHLIKTNKFKTILFKFVFRDEIKKDKITIRNVLIDNLLMTSKKYNSRKKIGIQKQNLYGLDVYGSNKRIGNHIMTEFSLSMLNPKYTEESMFEESLDFFCELLFNPNVTDNSFDEEYFNVIKNNTASDIKRINDNPLIVATNKLKDEIDENSPFAFKMEGYIEDLDKITSTSLYEYYKEFMKKNLIDVYVVGDFDFYDMEHLLKEKLKFNTIKKQKEDVYLDYETRGKQKEKIEESSFIQSKLVMGLTFKNATDKEKKYVIPLYNAILGNSPESKLFKNVREKKSFAYSINSSFRRLDGLMIISAGISSKNYKEAASAIKEEIEAMKKGDFTEEDITNAKELFISVLNDTFEYLTPIIDYYFNIEYLDAETIEKQLQEVINITKEDIVNVANKIKLDTTLLLKESKHEED